MNKKLVENSISIEGNNYFETPYYNNDDDEEK